MAGPATVMPFRFLSLHLEIRRWVYDQLYDYTTIFDADKRTNIWGGSSSLRVAAPTAYRPILQINRQIRREFQDHIDHRQKFHGPAKYHVSIAFTFAPPLAFPNPSAEFGFPPQQIVRADLTTILQCRRVRTDSHLAQDLRGWLASASQALSVMTNLKRLSVELWLVGAVDCPTLLGRGSCVFGALQEIVASKQPLLEKLELSGDRYYRGLSTYSVKWTGGHWTFISTPEDAESDGDDLTFDTDGDSVDDYDSHDSEVKDGDIKIWELDLKTASRLRPRMN